MQLICTRIKLYKNIIIAVFFLMSGCFLPLNSLLVHFFLCDDFIRPLLIGFLKYLL